MAQATRGDNDVLLRVVGEKGATEQVKHVVEMVATINCLHIVVFLGFYVACTLCRHFICEKMVIFMIIDNQSK